jgi:hypothetical protein
MPTTQLHVRKNQLANTRVVTLPDGPLAEGQVRVRVDQFAYSSNNITYAAFGDAMQYWHFFPVDAEWGCVPVWGFGEVVASMHAGVPVGVRLYGYWPTASHVVLQPDRVSPRGFADAAPHRAALHAVYNQYVRCDGDAMYTASSEAQQALLRPLFLTAWLIDEFLADNGFFGTAQAQNAQPPGVMLLSSASSKTAYATAAHLAKRSGVEVVGLTSPGNVAFCESLGVYSRVLTYDQLDALPPDTPCVYVDFAGNGALRRSIHSRFTRLAYSCSIGGTHVDQLAGSRDLAGPKPVLFFAPAQAKKRSVDWGPELFNQRLVAAWHGFLARVSDAAAPWITVQRHAGADAVQAAHAVVLAGKGDPRVGHVLTFAS